MTPGRREAVLDAPDATASGAVLLEARRISAGYGPAPVIRDVELAVRAGEIAVLLGPNGAGKTTTLHTLAGVITPQQGEVLWLGAPAPGSLHARARAGLAFVSETRSIFSSLTVRENLRVAGTEHDFAVELFPELKPLIGKRVGLLSGGEQQMLALALALGRRPRALLADELSLGLAPLIVERLLETLRVAASEGLGVLLVEQHVRQVLGYADHVSVLRGGEIALSGPGAEMRTRVEEIEDLYLR